MHKTVIICVWLWLRRQNVYSLHMHKLGGQG